MPESCSEKGDSKGEPADPRDITRLWSTRSDVEVKENNANLLAPISNFPHDSHPRQSLSHRRYRRYSSSIMADKLDPTIRADALDPTINMLLNNPNLFKMPARTPGQESSSSAQGSAAQPETNLKITTMGLKSWGNTGDASKAGVDNVGDSEQTIPDEFSVSEVSDGYKGARPDFGGGSSSPEYSGSEFDHDSDAEAGTPSKSKEGKAEPSLSELMKLAEEYDESPDQESQQSLADLLLELPAPLNESSAKRSTSPPLDHALARRASILGYKKPSASRLRNEIHDSSADDDKLAQTKGKKLLANVDFQKQPHASEERATDGKATSSFGNSIDTERADELAAFAHLLPKSKAYREGITKEKTTQSWVERTRLVQGIMLQESVADKDSLIPPIVLLNGAPETTDFMVRIPTPF